MAELLTFGALLRRYRKQTLDPHTQGPLSQIRLAEKVHQSTATISYWENDQRTIDAQDRTTLLLLLTTLSEHNGIHSLAEANALLEAGNYRALDQEESVRLQRFYSPPQALDEPDAPPTDTPTQIHLSLDRLALFFRPDTAPDESRLAGLVLNWLEYPFKLFTPEGALRLIGILGL